MQYTAKQFIISLRAESASCLITSMLMLEKKQKTTRDIYEIHKNTKFRSKLSIGSSYAGDKTHTNTLI